MVKKITAPNSYNPGKGRPQEYLAYLNQREMAYLRSLNGNNMERGPRGLPSFPPDDAVGSSSKSSGSSSRSSSSSSGAGRDSDRGLGQGAGGSAVGRGPSGGGNLGGGGKGAGASNTPSRGPGGPSGPNSSPSQSSGSKAAPSAPSRTPSSPMGGQGQSFRSPMGAGWANRDAIERQKAQVNDTRGALSKSPAVKGDLAVGGIRSLSVGPMGTRVNVGRPISVGQDFRAPQAGTISRSVAESAYKYSSPLTPGTSPEDMARRGAMMTQMEQEIRDINRLGAYERTGDPISAGGVPTSSFSPTKYGSSPSFPRSEYSGATFDPENDIQQRGLDRAMIDKAIKDSLGPASKPAASAPIKDMTVDEIVEALRPSGLTRSASPFGADAPKKSAFESELEKMMQPDISIPAPPNPEEKILKVEDYYPGRPTYTDGTYTTPYDKPSQTYTSVAGGMGNSPFNQTPYAERLNPESTTTNFSGKFKEGEGIEKSAVGRDARYGGSWRSDSEPPAGDQPADAGEPTDDVYGPKNVSPEVQELMKDIEKKNKYGTRVMKTIGRPLAPLDALRGLITGKNTAEADADLKRAYMQGSPAQKAELEAKYPNLTKFADMAGLEPQLPMSNYESWRQKSFGTGGFGTSGGIASLGGNRDDIGSGGKAEPNRIVPARTAPTKADKAEKEDGSRPAIYYKWDLGMDVPSPGDSDYTLYLQYLQEKAAAGADEA